MRLYLHTPGSLDVAVVEDVDPDANLSAIVEVGEGDFVFVDDGEEPVDVQLSIVEILGVSRDEPGHHHVHRHPCREIIVEVVYNGRGRAIPARPGTHVETLVLRAISEFGIDPVTGADLVLRFPGSDDDLPSSECVGSLVVPGSCSLTLNLLPGHREQG
jgi:hypothetical protein